MHTIVLNTKPQYLKAPEETGRGGVAEEAAKNKATPDFAKLIADSHLTREEVRIMKELYESKKENITLAIKGQLKDFIIKDYGEANRQYLGGFEGIVALQKILGVEPDGSFGPDTFKALIEYQGSNGLEKDGIAGPDTMKKIGITSKIQGTMSGVQDKNSTPTPLNKNTEKGGIKEASTPLASTSVEKPRKDVGKILSSFEFKLNGIQNSFSDLKKNRDENTGFFNVLADDLVNLAGGESGKKIYERSNQHIKNQASEMIKSLDANLRDIPLSDSERAQYLKIRSEFEKTLGHTLGEPNAFLSIANTLNNASEKTKHGVNYIADLKKDGYTKGLNALPDSDFKTLIKMKIARDSGREKGLGDVVGGIFDLTGVAFKMLGSSEYRNRVLSIGSKLLDHVDKEGFDVVWAVCYKIGLEMDKISNEPLEKQAELLGRIEGNIIGMFATGGAIGALSKAKGAATATSEVLQVAAKTAQVAGKSEQAAALAISASEQASRAMVYKVGAFILNGPVESAIGTGLSKSFRLASGAIRGGVSAKNLKTVEESIQDFGDAMKNETNPERLKYLREAQEALESERDKLAKNIAAKEEKGEKSDNPESEAKVKESGISSSAPKAFDVSGIDTPEGFKKTYRKVSMYYHPDRNSHPDSEALFKELKVAFGENDADRFARVAKNPEEYLKNKDGIAEGAGKPLKTPTEVILDRLSDYEKVFSESYLRQLAQSDPQEFGMAMVHQYQIRQIKELANTDPVEALKKGEAYLKSPDKYLKSAYPSAYYPIDKDIRGFANEAYAGAYKTELGLLQKRYNDTLENYLKNNPDPPKGSFERVQKVTNNLDEVMGLLGSKASDIAKNIEEIMSLLRGNIKNNLSEIRTRIDAVIESVRLNQNISLDIKKRISSKIKDIKVLFSNKNSSNIEASDAGNAQKPETERNFGTENSTPEYKNVTDLPSRYEKGIKQAQRYNKNSADGRFEERIEDGFVDGGRSADFFTNREDALAFMEIKANANPRNTYTLNQFEEGKFGVSSREFIRVDKTNDPILQDMINHVKKITSNASQSEKARTILQFVFEEGDHIGGERVVELSYGLSGVKNLGNIFQEGAAVCRHRSLMVQVLGKELGLDVAIRKGAVLSDDGIIGQHAWNEIKINGKWQVVDTMYLPSGSSPTNFGTYRDMPHLGTKKNGEFIPMYKIDEMREAA